MFDRLHKVASGRIKRLVEERYCTLELRTGGIVGLVVVKLVPIPDLSTYTKLHGRVFHVKHLCLGNDCTQAASFSGRCSGLGQSQ